MENTKVFRTKTGRCEISSKKISLVRTGWRGKGAEILQSMFEKKSAPIPSEIEKEKFRINGKIMEHLWRKITQLWMLKHHCRGKNLLVR